jgi:hypothetical protein
MKIYQLFFRSLFLADEDRSDAVEEVTRDYVGIHNLGYDIRARPCRELVVMGKAAAEVVIEIVYVWAIAKLILLCLRGSRLVNQRKPYRLSCGFESGFAAQSRFVQNLLEWILGT